MPKRVDHDERRREIAEAVFAVIGSRGFDAVSLRDVATQAGVSMGRVQHYFTSKDEMLQFALGHMRARVLTRLHSELAQLTNPTRREAIRAGMRAMLPVDEPSRQEACVNIAYFSLATVTPVYAKELHEAYTRILSVSRTQLQEAEDAGELAEGVDVENEATALFFLTQGLVGPVLIGLFTPDEVMALVDHRLGRIFSP